MLPFDSSRVNSCNQDMSIKLKLKDPQMGYVGEKRALRSASVYPASPTTCSKLVVLLESKVIAYA